MIRLRIGQFQSAIRNPKSAIRNLRIAPYSLPSPLLPTVELYTDGACSGNPGPGGWAFLLRHPASGKKLVRSGGEPLTTNNKMELTGVVRGLEALKQRSGVELFTDSVYVGKVVPIANEELWRELDQLLAKHQVKYTRVAGHSGHEENDLVDKLAVEAYQQYL
jgi:ribonuclease HI